MRREQQNKTHRIREYVQRHPEGLNLIELAKYALEIGVVDQEFTEAVSDMIRRGDVFEMRPGILVPLDPIDDENMDLNLTDVQREQIAYLIGKWYGRWRHKMTENGEQHRLGFAREDLKLILTGTAEDKTDARQKIATLRARAPELALLIEGHHAQNR